ncbi:MAG TPA: methyltransferase domain-containing protein, partial [SAR86 cluster bacterium]|nr:methyltransferase domain-containing protein [SAR86 cluster bacterium]
MHKKPKSFVLRQGRITQNQKEALDSLWNKFVIEDISEINQFLKDKHSVLDIGFGSGETLLHIAENKREVSVLGVEVYLSGIGAVLSKANELGLENIKIFNNDAEDLLRKNILPSSFDEIIMFYPDPWPKRKHHKRRLIKKDFIKVIN